MLPTRHGNFRLRGYKHSVSRALARRASALAGEQHLFVIVGENLPPTIVTKHRCFGAAAVLW